MKVYLPVIGIAALVLTAASLVSVTTASGAVRAEVGPIRANAAAASGYAAVAWPGSDGLTGNETLIVRLYAAPSASARVNIVGATGIGGTSTPSTYARFSSRPPVCRQQLDRVV